MSLGASSIFAENSSRSSEPTPASELPHIAKPLKFLTPIDCFIEVSYRATGDRVKTGEEILLLDTSELRNNRGRMTTLQKMMEILESRLEPAFVDEYIYGPLLSEVSSLLKDVARLRTVESETADRFKVGEVTLADLAAARRDVAQGSAAVASKREDYELKRLDIEKQRAMRDVAKQKAVNELAYIESQIGRRSIKAPMDGVVTYNVVPGMFVERGDTVVSVA